MELHQASWGGPEDWTWISGISPWVHYNPQRTLPLFPASLSPYIWGGCWDPPGSLHSCYPGNSDSSSEGVEFRLEQWGGWQVMELETRRGLLDSQGCRNECPSVTFLFLFHWAVNSWDLGWVSYWTVYFWLYKRWWGVNELPFWFSTRVISFQPLLCIPAPYPVRFPGGFTS